MNSAVVCDYHVTVTSKVRFVNFGSMHSSVNRAFPWKTVHKRLNHVKLSYTCKYPIKRTDLFDVTIEINPKIASFAFNPLIYQDLSIL